jgi:uncharacterized membrane protein YGL010W
MFSLPTRTVIVHEVLHRSTTLPLALYIVGFALQIVGGVLVVLEVRDDVRTANKLAAPVTYGTIELFPRFVRERLSSHMGRRVIGVVLIFVGAGVGLAANLLALQV